MKTKIKSFFKKSLIIIFMALGVLKVNASDTIQLISHTLPTQLNVGKWLEFTVTYSSTNLNDTLELYGNINYLGDIYPIIGINKKSSPTQATKDSIYINNGLLYTKFKVEIIFHPTMIPIEFNKTNNWILNVCNKTVCSQDTLSIFPKSVADSLLPSGTFPSGEMLKTFERKKYDLNQFFSNPLCQDTIWTTKGKIIDTNYIYHINCDTILDTNIVYINNWYLEEQMEPAPYNITICNPIDSNDCDEVHAGDMPWYIWKLFLDTTTVYSQKVICDTTIESIYDTNYHLTSPKIDTSTVIQVTPYITVHPKDIHDTTYQKVQMFGNDTIICHPIYLDSCEHYSDTTTFIYIWEMVINTHTVYDTSWVYDTTKFHIYDTSYINNFTIEKKLRYHLTFWKSLSNFDGSYFNITENTLEVFADEYANPGNNGYNLYMFIENDSSSIVTLIEIGYQEYLLAYLNQVNFETQAQPGDYWESRFNYGDIVKPTFDTIILDGLPNWVARENYKYWLYKANYYSSTTEDPDSVWVNRAILKGTVPKSILKSSSISHVIGAQYCKDGDCIPRKEYVLTITDDGVTQLEPLANSHSIKSVNVYPNPATSYININGSDLTNVIVMDMYGRIVYNQLLSLPSKIQIDDWLKGMYLLRIDNDKETKTFKIIKD